jgi:hypothetical protein
MRLAEADDAIRDASTVCVIENGLLADQLADHLQLLVDIPSGGQKTAATCDQSVKARQIPLEVAKLQLDSLADLTDTGPLLLGHSKQLLSRSFAECTRLVAKAFPYLRIHRINQDLSHLPGYSFGEDFVNIE